MSRWWGAGESVEGDWGVGLIRRRDSFCKLGKMVSFGEGEFMWIF